MGIDKEAAGAEEETATHGNKRAEETMRKMKGNGDEPGGREQLLCSFIIPRPASLHPDWMLTRLLFYDMISQSHNHGIVGEI